MRKIIVFNLISLDGYYAGEDGSIDWHNVDDEFNKFAVEHTSQFGAIIFGRVTYKIFESFWPKALKDPTFSEDDHKIAKIIDDVEKIVFSKSLKKVTWNNSKLFHNIDQKEVRKWKKNGPPSPRSSTLRTSTVSSVEPLRPEGLRRVNKDLAIFGSGKIVHQFANLGLVDEYRLMVNPVVLGKGKPMFENVKKLNLKLTKTRTFKNGNVLLYYQTLK